MDVKNLYQQMLDDFHAARGRNYLQYLGLSGWFSADMQDRENKAIEYAAIVSRHFEFLGAPADVVAHIERLMRERLLAPDYPDVPF